MESMHGGPAVKALICIMLLFLWPVCRHPFLSEKIPDIFWGEGASVHRLAHGSEKRDDPLRSTPIWNPGQCCISLYISGKLPTYLSPKLTFCPKWAVMLIRGGGGGRGAVSLKRLMILIIFYWKDTITCVPYAIQLDYSFCYYPLCSVWISDWTLCLVLSILHGTIWVRTIGPETIRKL